MKKNDIKAIIRIAGLSDLKEIAEIEKQNIECPWSEKVISECLINERYSFIVCEIDSKIVGYGSVAKIADESEIGNIAVDFSYRRKGIASRILSKLIDIAKQYAHKIYLEVNEKNIAAINLYIKNGFTSYNIRQNYYGTDNAVLMQKKI